MGSHDGYDGSSLIARIARAHAYTSNMGEPVIPVILSTELALMLALEGCENAPDDMPAAQILALAASQYGVNADELCIAWLRKLTAVRRARSAIAGSRAPDDPEPDNTGRSLHDRHIHGTR